MNVAKKKIVRKHLILSSLIVIILSSLLVIFIIKPWIQNQISKRLATVIKQETGVDAYIGSIRFNYFSNAQFRDVWLKYKNQTVSLRLLSVDFKLASLLKRQIYIKRILVDSLYIDLVKDAEEPISFPSTAKKQAKPGKKQSFELIIENITLSRSVFRYYDGTIPLDAKAKNIQVAVDRNDTIQSYAARFSVGEIGVNNYPKLAAVETVVSYYQNNLVIQKGQARFGYSVINANGTLALNDSLNADIGMNGSIDVSDAELITDVIDTSITIPRLKGVFTIGARVRGPIHHPTINYNLSSDSLQVDGLDLSSVSLGGEFKYPTLAMNTINCHILNGTVNGSAIATIDTASMKAEMTIRAKGMTVEDVTRKFMTVDSIRFHGSLDGEFSVNVATNELNKFQSSMMLKISNATFDNKNVSDFICQASIKNRLIHAHFLNDDNYITAQGFLLDSNRVVGDVNVNLQAIAPLLQLVNVSDIDGKLLGEGKISGQMFNPHVKAGFQVESLTFRDMPVANVKGKVTLTDRKLSVDEVIFHGHIDDLSQLQSWIPQPSISGNIDYYGQMTGNVSNPNVFLRARGRTGSIALLKYDSLYVSASLKNRIVSLDQAEIQVGDSIIAMKGLITLQDKLQFSNDIHLASISGGEQRKLGKIHLQGLLSENKIHADVRGDSIEVGTITHFLTGQSMVEGTVNFIVAMNGDISQPQVLFSVTADNVKHEPLELDEIQCNGQIREGVIWIRKASFTYAKDTIYMSGYLPLAFLSSEDSLDTSSLDMTVTGENLTFKFIDFLKTDYSFSDLNFDIFAKLSGTVRKPLINGNVDISFDRLERTSSKLVILDNHLKIDISQRLDNPKIRIKWNCGESEFESFKFTAFEGSVVYSDSVLKLENAKIHLNKKASTIQGQFPVAIAFKPARFQVLQLEPLSINSYADSLNMTVLTPIIPMVDKVSGILNYSIKITGTPAQPRINGFTTVRSGGVRITNMEPDITNIQADVSFDETKTDLTNLSALVGDGTIRTQGTVFYDTNGKIKDLKITSNLNNIRMILKDIITARLRTGEINFARQNSEYDLSGNLDFQEIRYIQDINLIKTALQSNKPKPATGHSGPVIHNNLTIKANESLWLYNNIAKIQMDADIILLGTMERPLLGGTIRSVGGYFYYLERKFVLENGNIVFSDPERINPNFQLSASTSIKSFENMNEIRYVINLKMDGNFDKPNVVFTSVPPLSQPDIIAVLTVGRTRNEMLVNGTTNELESFRDILIERARSITNHTISQMAEKQVGTLLNLDNISIEGDLLSMQGKGGPKVTASKKLTEGLDLTYSTVVGYSNDQMIKLGYRISDNIALEGESDQRGRTGIDLKFKYKF
ncbi:translocation/assembly module TamB domain-containing protein [candidate division KSB1 bacterium]|nr:translocation/assembly module TamB domain-containing protein [candidate division KSB1 bacterium]